MTRSRWDNVLVLQTSFLGDSVLTLPLISEIKRRFPGAKLTLLCSPTTRDLLLDHPDIDGIIVDDKKAADKGWLGLWRKARSLRQRAFTMALSPHKSFRSALLLFLARIPVRVGFYQSKGWFLFNSRVNRNAEMHDVERNLSILDAFGIQSRECQRAFELRIKPELYVSVDRHFRSVGIDPTKSIMGVNPGSVWPTKRWAPEGFARLIDLLKQKYDCEVVLFGGPADAEVAAKIQKLSGAATPNLAGKVTLREFAAAISRCRVFITNDSGPMHIAVACHVPTVGIFCATTPSLGYYPYSSQAVVVEKDLPCRPCSSHGGRRCPLGTEDCIRLIRPEHVMQAVEKLVGHGLIAPSNRGNIFQPEFMTV